MKNIKDYLHLYLGAECQFESEIFTLAGVYGYIAQSTEADESGEGTYGMEDVKPILRPLTDITKEEMKELWQLVFKRKFGMNGSIRFYDSLGKDIQRNDISRWVLSSGVERLGVQFDGHVWADSDLQFWKHNQHEVTQYFLSKHFDIFHLVESGLAIDATTLVAKEK